MATRKGNGEGTVRYLAAKKLYEARLVLDGNVRKSFYGKTKAEVLRKMRQAQHARDRGLPVLADERQTLGQYLPYWLDVKKPQLKTSTWMRYRVLVLIHLIPALGRVQLVKLTPQHLQRLYAQKLDEGWSPTTAHHLHTVLHGALEQACRWGLVARNVSDLVDAPRLAKPQMHVWTPEQANAFLATVAAAGDRLEALYVLALTTGMRQGELLALQWGDLLLEGSQPSVTVRRNLEMQEHGKRQMGKPKTETGRRRIDLSMRAVEALRVHRTHQLEERLATGAAWDDQDLVFCNSLGRHLEPNNVKRRSFIPMKRAAGVPDIRFHDLRHTAATVLLIEGVAAKIVSEMLGHASIAITLNTYSHVLPTMQKSAAAAMDRLFG